MEEEVLELYEAPYDPMRPVVCFDFRESVFFRPKIYMRLLCPIREEIIPYNY